MSESDRSLVADKVSDKTTQRASKHIYFSHRNSVKRTRTIGRIQDSTIRRRPEDLHGTASCTGLSNHAPAICLFYYTARDGGPCEDVERTIIPRWTSRGGGQKAINRPVSWPRHWKG